MDTTIKYKNLLGKSGNNVKGMKEKNVRVFRQENEINQKM